MKWLSTFFLNWLYLEGQKNDAILLPMRLFIGLGWMRAGMEKLIDPAWHNGVALSNFFDTQIADNAIVFPLYQSLVSGLFLDYSQLLSRVIMAGELYAGLAIFFGVLTKPALVAGIFMNVNFILAGVVSPSAFYIIIQMALLPSRIGTIFGVDVLMRTLWNRRPWQPSFDSDRWQRRKLTWFMMGAVACALFAATCIPYVRLLDPAQSVKDPAILLLLLLWLQTTLFLILAMRTLATLNALEVEQKLSPQSMPTESGSPNLSRDLWQSAAAPQRDKEPPPADLPEPDLSYSREPSIATTFWRQRNRFWHQHDEKKPEYRQPEFRQPEFSQPVHKGEAYAEPYNYPLLDRHYYDQLLQDLCRSVNED